MCESETNSLNLAPGRKSKLKNSTFSNNIKYLAQKIKQIVFRLFKDFRQALDGEFFIFTSTAERELASLAQSFSIF